MLIDSLHSGLTSIRQRPGLALLLFGVNALLAYLIASPLGTALNITLGPTGFGADPGGLDVVLLADFFERNPSVIPTLVSLILLLLPLMLLWSTAVGVGLIHAFELGGGRSFWDGVYTWFWKGLGLTALFLVPVGAWTFLSIVLGIVVNLVWTGEVASFWTWAVLVPTAWITGIAAIDMMHDYARISLVAGRKGIWGSALAGIGFPLRHGSSHLLYLAWFVLAMTFTLLPTAAEWVLGASLAVFLFQQLLLTARAAVTVGWMASQVSLWEAFQKREAVLIAEQMPDEGPDVSPRTDRPAFPDPGQGQTALA